MLPLVQVAKESSLNDETDQSYTERGYNKGQDKSLAPPSHEGRNAEGEICADHIKRAMRDIGYAEDPEDKAETGSYDKQNRAPTQSHQYLLEQPRQCSSGHAIHGTGDSAGPYYANGFRCIRVLLLIVNHEVS